MCNIRRRHEKKREEKRKEIYLSILFKQREGVLLVFHLGEVTKNGELGCGEAGPRLGCGEAEPQAGAWRG